MSVITEILLKVALNTITLTLTPVGHAVNVSRLSYRYSKVSNCFGFNSTDSGLLVEETGVHGKKHQPVPSH
jgi:hypothetical protein